MKRTPWILWAGAACLAAMPALAQFTPEELAERDRWESFLETAEIVAAEQMSQSEGVTEPYKLTLRQGDVERHALWKNARGRMGGFWEGWQYEVAAYRLDKYLGLGMVPPTVERRFREEPGSAQLWVQAWSNMMEVTDKKLSPPPEKIRDWNNATYLQRAFDNLVANTDRHMRNILVTEDWRMILIDHSRAFRVGKRHTKRLIFDERSRGGPKLMKRLPRRFVEKLRALDLETLKGVVGEYLSESEMEAVLARRDLMLEAIERQIAKNGEAAVLY